MRAAWVWVDDAAPPNAAALAGFAAQRGVAEAFVSIPWGGPTASVREVVRALAGRGIRVTALGGDDEWSRRPALAAEWAGRAHAGRMFAGTHLDIEPWTRADWRADADALLSGVARAVSAVRVAAASAGPVEVDLAPLVASTHPGGFARVVRASDAVTLMSYRTRAEAIVAMSEDARRIVRTTGRPFRLAVDTVPGDPATTFAGRRGTELDRVVAEASRLVGPDPRFRGFAVHDLAGCRALPR